MTFQSGFELLPQGKFLSALDCTSHCTDWIELTVLHWPDRTDRTDRSDSAVLAARSRSYPYRSDYIGAWENLESGFGDSVASVTDLGFLTVFLAAPLPETQLQPAIRPR